MKLKHVKHYIPDYPRPQFVRPDWVNLNGKWDFMFDDLNEGEAKGWHIKFPANPLKINVPFCYLASKSCIGDKARHDFVWYGRRINIPAAKLAGRVNLIFEGCDYVTKVWVNGKPAGGHKGGYTRFELDITGLLTAGENALTVKAEDGFNTDRPRGKQRWQAENFGCWYEETTGIHKTVWCEFTGKKYIGGAEITPLYEGRAADLTFNVPGGRGLTVTAEAELNGTVAARGSALVNADFTRLTLNLAAENAEWETDSWDLSRPALYDLTFTLTDGAGNVLDKAGSYTGLRKFDASGDRVRLNYSPVYFKMLLDQGYWADSHLTPPDEKAIERDVLLTLEAGFNGIRKHQKIEDERFYYYCDILGVMAWCEMPSCYAFNDAAVENTAREWSEAVRQLRNHPCIAAWVPFNESWGVKNIRADRRQQTYTEAVCLLTKTLDRHNRPVISNDGWEHTESDIITIHNYAQTGEGLAAAYGDKGAALADAQVAGRSFRAVFAEGHSYRGQPVVISEYGGIAFARDKSNGWGYGEMVKDEKEYLARLESLTDAIKSLPYVCGYCLTQTTDVQQELNGVFDMSRKPKADIREIKRINDK